MKPKIFKSIPDSWRAEKISKLIEEGYITGHLDGNHGNLYPKNSEFVGEGTSYISANSLIDGRVNFKLAKYLTKERADRFKKGVALNGDVLFAHNATVGPTAILKTDEEKVILSTSLTYYRCDDSMLYNEYLKSYFESPFFKFQYERVMGQSTRNQVPILTQRDFFVIVPPIIEQKAINKYFEKWDESIEKLRKLIRAKRELKKGFAAQLLTRKKRLDGFSDEWKEFQIKECILLLKSGLSRALESSDVGIPVVRANNVGEKYSKDNDLKYWYINDPQGANTSNFILDNDDLLINFINSEAGMGKTCLFKNSLGRDYIYTTNILRMKTNDNLLPEYFYQYSKLPKYNNEIKKITKPAVNQASFTTVDFKKIKLYLPSYKEQIEIVKLLKAMDDELITLCDKMKSVKKQKKGLMQQLLTGKKRVNIK
jgi:type I restriction enzyme S subunit